MVPRSRAAGISEVVTSTKRNVDESPQCRSIQAWTDDWSRALSEIVPTVFPFRSFPLRIGEFGATQSWVVGAVSRYSAPGAMKTNGKPRERAAAIATMFELPI